MNAHNQLKHYQLFGHKLTSSFPASVFVLTVTKCFFDCYFLQLRPLLEFVIFTSCQLRLEWCHAELDSIATEWNQVTLRDELKFNFCNDDINENVWRSYAEHLNKIFLLYRLTVITSGVMDLCANTYDIWSPPIFIYNVIAIQWYVRNIFQLYALPCMTGIQKGILQPSNACPWTVRKSYFIISTLFPSLTDPQIFH